MKIKIFSPITIVKLAIIIKNNNNFQIINKTLPQRMN
jgi:hypothetical protein